MGACLDAQRPAAACPFLSCRWGPRPQKEEREEKVGFQGMWRVGQCPSGGVDGICHQKHLVFRLLIHVQFSLTMHFYVISDF